MHSVNFYLNNLHKGHFLERRQGRYCSAKVTDKTPILLSITPLELRSIRGYEPFSVHSGSVSGPLRSIPKRSTAFPRLRQDFVLFKKHHSNSENTLSQYPACTGIVHVYGVFFVLNV